MYFITYTVEYNDSVQVFLFVVKHINFIYIFKNIASTTFHY